jgi:antirestriction protein ArdC
VTGPIVFGSSDYSREELVAELTSAFICAELGLDNSLIQDSASYVSGWLNLLNEDKRAIMVASSQARHACDYIKGSQAST